MLLSKSEREFKKSNCVSLSVSESFGQLLVWIGMLLWVSELLAGRVSLEFGRVR